MATSTMLDRSPEMKEATPTVLPAPAAPKPPFEASTDALAFCQELLLLEPNDPVSLDMVLEHAVVGTAQDRAFLKRQCTQEGEPLTLGAFKATLIQVIQKGAQAASKLVLAPKAATPEEAANIILSYCTPEVHNGMQYAQEILGELPHKIIAAMLCLQYENLAGGDFSQVLEIPENGGVPGATPASPRVVLKGIGSSICDLKDSQGEQLCGKSFTPERRGQKYGCQACGECADTVTKNAEALKRKAEDAEYAPSRKIESVDKNRCSCGQAQ